MSRHRTALAIVAGLFLCYLPNSLLADEPTNVDKLGSRFTDLNFTLPDGKSVSLSKYEDRRAIVIVFLSFDCPVSNAYSAEVNSYVKEYAEKGVTILGVCCQEDVDVTKKAKEFRLTFPVFADPKGRVAGKLKATTTPEAFVLDQHRVLRYRGRIDDTWYARLKRNAEVSRKDLRVALDELLAGKSVSVPSTDPIGCPIFLDDPKPAGEVTTKYTFHRDVQPILQRNCEGCHRPGAVGPFALMNYKHAVNWGEDIKTYTQSREMPPWKPTEGGPFAHNRSMPQPEIDILADWVDGGMPEGDPKDAPKAVSHETGWNLGEPDLVLEMPEEFHVGASGTDVFRCFVLPTGLTEDKYITAVDVRPGNPSVVHHTLNFFDLSGKGRELQAKAATKEPKPKSDDRGPGYSVAMGVGFTPQRAVDGKQGFGGLGGWAPGSVARKLPDGTGYFLPAGADIILQVHYHRTGRAEVDRTRIGLYFAKKPIEKPWETITIPGRFLFIPAKNPAYTVKGLLWVQDDCTIHSVMPHMHLLGKKVKVTMTPPEGKTRTLVQIDDWDYNWQETYWFENPISVKAGTRFEIEAVYDNSSGNPNNPFNPPRLVVAGDQTTDEMLFGFIGATKDTPGRIRRTIKDPESE